MTKYVNVPINNNCIERLCFTVTQDKMIFLEQNSTRRVQVSIKKFRLKLQYFTKYKV